MDLPTEPIGSIPRPPALIDAILQHGADAPQLESLYDDAIADTLARFEATGSPVVSDGEQRKYHNFWTYCVHGMPNTSDDGFRIPFKDGHVRRLPRLTAAPMRYKRSAASFVRHARQRTKLPVKQAVIAPSALSLLYGEQDLPGYPRDQFLADLTSEHVREVRECFEAGAHCVQVDFTEARFALKLDPSGEVLTSFIDLNNLAFAQLTPGERARIGVHTCPGGDRDSTHSADVDYAELLPALLQMEVGSFYVALAGEREPERVLKLIADHLRPGQRVFIGVVSSIDPHLDTPQEVCDRVLQAARYIPLEQLGTTDDCGFAPFCDDRSTTRDTAFAKIQARVEGTRMASRVLFG